MKQYLLNVLIAFDQFVNTWLGGYPDETLSASAYIGEQQGKLFPRLFRPVIDFLFSPIERDHCRKAYLAEITRAQLPRMYRQGRI